MKKGQSGNYSGSGSGGGSSSSSNNPDINADSVFHWLKNDLKPVHPSGGNLHPLPSLRAIRQVCRGNMIPVWRFLLERVKSEENVNEIRGNITIQNASSTRKTHSGAPFKSDDERKLVSEPSSVPNRSASTPFSPTKSSEKSDGKQFFRSKIRPPKISSTLLEGSLSPKSHGLDASSSRFSPREHLSFSERFDKLHAALEQREVAFSRKLSRLRSDEDKRFFSILDSTDTSARVAILEAYDFHCEELIEFISEIHRQLRPSILQIQSGSRTSRNTSAFQVSEERRTELLGYYDGTNEDGRAVEDELGSKEARFPEYEAKELRMVKQECENVSRVLKQIFYEICPAYSIDSNNFPGRKAHVHRKDMQRNDYHDVRGNFGFSDPNAILHADFAVSSKSKDDDPLIEKIRWLMKAEGEEDEKRKMLIFEILNSGMRDFAVDPDEFLENISKYTSFVSQRIENDYQRINVKADAENLRFEYETSKVLNESEASNDGKFSKPKKDFIFTTTQLLEERLQAHINQFQETERLESEANECNSLCLKLLKTNFDDYKSIFQGQQTSEDDNLMDETSGSRNHDSSYDEQELEKLKMEVLSLEIGSIASKAAIKAFENEESRLNRLKSDLIGSSKILDEKFKSIQEFNENRTELEHLHSFLLKMNKVASEKIEHFATQSQSFFLESLVKDGQTLKQRLEDCADLIFQSVQSFSEVSPKALSNASILQKQGSKNIEGTKDEYITRCFYNDVSEHEKKIFLKEVFQLSDQELGFHWAFSPEKVLEHVSDSMLESLSLRHVAQIAQSKIEDVGLSSQDLEQKLSECVSSVNEHETLIEKEKLKQIKEAYLVANNSYSDIERISQQMNYWWNQPGGYVVDWLTFKGMTASQWLTKVKMWNSNLGSL